MANTSHLSTRPLLSYALAALLLMPLAACQQDKSPGPGTDPQQDEKEVGEPGQSMQSEGDPVKVSGRLVYLQRIALPPEARATVQLLDVSLADAPATVLAEEVVELENRQVPIPFSLQVSDGDLDPRHSYSVSARIEDGKGQLLWITDSHHGVNAGQEGDIELGDIRLTQVVSKPPQSENRQ